MIWFVWIDTVAIISDTIITCAFWMIQTKQFIRKRRLPPVHISQISVFMVTTLFKEIHDEFLETFSIFGCWCIQKVLWRMWNCRSMRFKFQLIGFCMNIVRLPHSNSDFQFMREWEVHSIFDGIQFRGGFVYEHFENYEHGRRCRMKDDK